MSLDKLVDSTQLDSDLTSVANAIRTKGGTSASLAFPADFITAINAISGGGGGGLKYKTGSFTLASDEQNITTAGSGIAHSLGVAPDVVIVWQETYTDSNIPTGQCNAGYIYLKRIMEFGQRLSSSASSQYSFYVNFTIAANTAVGVNVNAPSSTTYMPSLAPTSTEFYLYKTGGNSNAWRANVAYKYFVAEKWW